MPTVRVRDLDLYASATSTSIMKATAAAIRC